LSPGAPLVWEQHGSNRCVDSEAGDKEATEAAFARAAHIVRLETTINRVTGVPMELRAAVGVCDEPTGRFTVYTSAGGGVIRQRDDIVGALGDERRRPGCFERRRREFRDSQQHLP
jgi:carbon-monoxide dehydrogenase large subunit